MNGKFGSYFKIDNNDTETRRTCETEASQVPVAEEKNEAPAASVQTVTDVYADCLIRHRRLSAELARRQSSKIR